MAAIDLDRFRRFARIRRASVPSAPSFGILTIRPEQPARTSPILIMESSIFSTSALRFRTLERAELSESADFLPVGVQCQTEGVIGNIASGAVWSSPIAGINVSNQNAFSGGLDAVPEIPGAVTDWPVLPDAELTECLAAAREVILKKLSAEALPDSPRVERAQLILATFFAQNGRNFQETIRKFGQGDELSETNTEYFRGDRVWMALHKEIDNLLASHTDVLAFMPDA